MNSQTDAGYRFGRLYQLLLKHLSKGVTTLFAYRPYVVAAVAAVALVLPFVSGQYLLNLYGYTLIYIVGVSGLDFVVGTIDELHLAMAPMIAIAGYGSALLALGWNVPFVASAVAGICLTVLFSVFIGLLGRTMGGLYFALASLALGELVRLGIHNFPDITQGPLGLTGIPDVGVFGFTVTDTLGYYYLSLAIVAVALVIKYNLTNSTVGDALKAVGQNEQLARSVGINALRYKLFAFGVNGVYAGVAGILYASYTGLLVPEDASLISTNDYLMMNIIGGIGTLTGPIYGAVTITLIPEFLRFTEGSRILLYGVTLVVVIIYAPGGIAGIINSFRGDT